MKNYIPFLLLLIISCAEESTNQKEISLEGYWKVDSVQVYIADTINEVYELEMLFELSKNEILFCGGQKDVPKYEIIQSDDGINTLSVTTISTGLIESEIKIADDNQIVLIKKDSKNDDIIKYWYHSRLTKEQYEELCVQRLRQSRP